MQEKLKFELIELDKKRLEIRNNYKNALINSVNNRKLYVKDYILFPKTLVSEDNYQLRYGVSWHRNGFVIKVGSNIIVVDPGVDFVLRLTESGFNLTDITHIVITHAHLDHASAANTLMDFMIRAKASVQIIAPISVYETKVISDFHSGIKAEFPINHRAITIDETSEIKLSDGYIMTFVSLIHSVPCYGFKITGNNKIYTHLSDTSYSTKILTKNNQEIIIKDIKDYVEEGVTIDNHAYIKEFVTGSDMLIANVDSFMYTKNSKTHLPLLDLIEIIKNNDVQNVILSHVNPDAELDNEKWGEKLAEYIFQVYKIKTYFIEKSGKEIEL
ncbi:MAG: MBL fold metallo-hydrolase [Bacilli bacterium]|nr:MBL fold metallo-hydrolase [Bacilli bacterium]